jgi:HK97 family phage prohead protease
MVDGATRIRIVRDRKAAVVIPFPKTEKKGRKFATFETLCDLSSQESKSFREIKDKDGQRLDFLDVSIKGYLSTWQDTTPEDRDGDYVVKGAFSDSIKSFMRNPIMLMNHSAKVEDAVGVFTVLREDGKGLYFEGMLSNSPSDRMKDVRSKVAENIIKTVSMGGRFEYGNDQRAIHKVTLFEGSLVSIPANPDALFSVRECTEAEAKQFQGVSS